MAGPRPPAPPKVIKKPPGPAMPPGDAFARMVTNTVRDAHGFENASTFDMSEELGSPRGYIGTRNLALDRALGTNGVPLGRVTEISGWHGAGKSTMLDQIFAQTQAEGGLAVLADTEYVRDRNYMSTLGVRFESLVWLKAESVEAMFDQVETICRQCSHLNVMAWWEALVRAKVKCPAPPTYKYEVFDPKDKNARKPIMSRVFASWGREQSAALMEWQTKQGIPAFGIRDAPSRALLRPCIFQSEDLSLKNDAIKEWVQYGAHPLVGMADRPIVIGWDSLAGTAAEAELEGDARGQHPAVAARVIKKNLRRLIQWIAGEAIAYVIVNQRYEKLMQFGQFKKESETYGGGGPKYHATIRIEVDRTGDIYSKSTDKENGIAPIGQVVEIRVPKNKLESPFHVEEYGLIYGRGADNAWAIFNDLKNRGIIAGAGGWNNFKDPTILGDRDRSWQGGWQGLSNMMAEDANLWAQLRTIYLEARSRS